MNRIRALALLALVSTLSFATAGADAADVQLYQYTFDGAGSDAGPFGPGGIRQIAVDEATGSLYATQPPKGAVTKFDVLGNPEKFSALDSTSLPYSGGRLSLNNFGAAAQGYIYLGGGSVVTGFKPDGTPISPEFPLRGWEGFGACAAEIFPSGNLLVFSVEYGGIPTWIYTAEGVYTGEQLTLDCTSSLFAGDDTLFDKAGYLYQGSSKLDPANGYTPVEPSPFLGPAGGSQVAIDPTTEDVYFAQDDRVVGYHSSNTPSQPSEVLTGFENAVGIAFDAEGNLYVADTGLIPEPRSDQVEVPGKVIVYRRGPSEAPTIKKETVGGIRTTLAEFGGEVLANGSKTSFRVEYGTDTSYGSTSPIVDAGSSAVPVRRKVKVEGLAPDTTYHYRVAVTNADGTTYSPDHILSTYPVPASGGGGDTCANALARKQTGARDLLDCRAYELVSARNTGGFDVESDLAPGQAPFAGYPLASSPSSVLYGVHAGVIPGTRNPTNRGLDPYLATRGESGWSTRYVGLEADINSQSEPFSSTLGGADSGLSTFAFAGADLCKPCFSEGIETGIPVRLPDGRLVQGMAGSLDPGPGATASGHVARHLSADGKHLVFGSTAKFEPDASTSGVTIYDRDLATSTTQVVSKNAGGTTLSGAGVGALDLSSDGSRILVGQKTATDSEGNDHWDLYLHLGDSPSSVDVTPGAADGVLYDGMSADGTEVYFTSGEKLLPEDSDGSADIYRAGISDAGAVDLDLVSAGSSTACSPVASSVRPSWNAVGAPFDCGAVAIGGGGGVASGSGDIYFLSPELLDGAAGTLDQPNLYVAAAGGEPAFVATLEPDNPLVRNSVADAAIRHTADFQVTPSGDDAVFTSSLALGSVEATGSPEVFRYHRSPRRIDCASCPPTNATNTSGAGGTLASDGLSLTDDGRVFFSTAISLVLKDTNNRLDVYEWAGGPPQLISAGTSSFDSGLLSVSADGVDAYFFTHDTLAPDEDDNGFLNKIYDARADGGFLAFPTIKPCAASDECHGPGTQQPGPPQIRTGGPTTQGNQVKPSGCRKSRVKKRGRCVRKPRRAKKRKGKHA